MEVVRRMLAPLEGRIRLMLSRAVVSLINDAAKAQELQVDLLADETQDGVERWQNYGFLASAARRRSAGGLRERVAQPRCGHCGAGSAVSPGQSPAGRGGAL
jgi:hypothetical protein